MGGAVTGPSERTDRILAEMRAAKLAFRTNQPLPLARWDDVEYLLILEDRYREGLEKIVYLYGDGFDGPAAACAAIEAAEALDTGERVPRDE